MKTIEVEYRALLTRAKYDKIKKVLDSEAELISVQDQASYYFHDYSKAFKMVHDKDKNRVRVAHKGATITQGSHFDEFEISISPAELDVALPMFKSLLGIDRVVYDEQKRINYSYQGLEIALKWSEGWGYHMEIEKVVGSEKEVRQAKDQIKSLANKLSIKLMTIEDIKSLVAEIERKLENNEYKVAGYI